MMSDSANIHDFDKVVINQEILWAHTADLVGPRTTPVWNFLTNDSDWVNMKFLD